MLENINTKRVAFYTLGCRVNQYETTALEQAFIKKGFTVCSFDEKCDVYVINTCTVTAESDRKSRQMIRRARKSGGEDAIVMAVGCMVQVDAKNAEKLPELDYAAGTRNKMSIVSTAETLLERKKIESKVVVTNFVDRYTMEDMSIYASDTTRAFLKISDGCNNNCSYCIIPKARGPVCSKKPEDVLCEIKALCENGWREIVLTGIETAAYGKDFEDYNLVSLIKTVNSHFENLYRIRLGSLEPAFMKENVIKEFSLCGKLMPHYHLSLQSGCDNVLARMRRKYNTRQFLQVIDNLRANIKDVTFTTDIIVGFPGETEDMFNETCEFVKKCGFIYVHIFPYSDRDSTDASKMQGKVPESVKKQRVLKLKEVMLETRKKVLLSFYGTTRPVLVEKVENGVAFGHTDNFIEVRFDTEKCTGIQKNDVVNVKLLGLLNDEETVFASLDFKE